MTSEKLVPISAKITLSQKEELEERANTLGMSLSDYMRNRLLSDLESGIDEEDKLTKYQKEILRTVKKCYYLTKLATVCNDSLPEQKIEEAIESGENFWIKNGYK